MGQAFTQTDVSGLEDPAIRRVLMTVSCRDTDSIPKVPDAGQVQIRDGRAVQVMHNGLLIDEGCYYGPWMTRVISGLGGHHEPQEEVIFDAIVARLARTIAGEPVIFEFGSFWSYYSMWFCRALPGARAVAMEPDPQYLEVGKRNAELNGLSDRIHFVHGAVGARPGETLEFQAESTGEVGPVVQHDLASLMQAAAVSAIDLAMVDIQGAETVLLERARDIFQTGRVRFIIVSTHHQAISGDPLTHQRALDVLRECGAHIIAEHTVRESYSGDGLIAATFDPEHFDLTVPIAHARAKESLFGEPEYELQTLSNEVADRDRLLTQNEMSLDVLRIELADTSNELNLTNQRVVELTTELSATASELAAVRATRIWRWARVPRAQYARLRHLGRT